jgi:hypothetical protein
MNPADIINYAAADGVTLTICTDGNMKAMGDQDIIAEWLPLIREHKSEIVRSLRQRLRHQRVLEMLESEAGKTYAVMVADAASDPVLASIAIRGLAVFDLHIPLRHYDALALLEVIEQHSKEATDKLSVNAYPLPQPKESNLSRSDEPQRRVA